MVDEDFVMGYVCGYNDGSGGGSGGGIVIPEGTATIYDVPLLKNHVFEGTEFGLGIIDVNECPFLNNFNDSGCYWVEDANQKTLEKLLLSFPDPSVSRRIAFAITKNNAVIGLAAVGSYDLIKIARPLYYTLADGSRKLTHGSITTGRIENQQITTTIIDNGSQYNMRIVFEYDLVTTVAKYATNYDNYKQGTNVNGAPYNYYDEADLDVYKGTETTTTHNGYLIGGMPNIKVSSTHLQYPDGLGGVYQMQSWSFPVDWGTTAENIRDFHLGLTTGLSE